MIELLTLIAQYISAYDQPLKEWDCHCFPCNESYDTREELDAHFAELHPHVGSTAAIEERWSHIHS